MDSPLVELNCIYDAWNIRLEAIYCEFLSYWKISWQSPNDSPNGTIDFVQIVPVTQEEFDAAHNWKATEIINLMEEIDPYVLFLVIFINLHF